MPLKFLVLILSLFILLPSCRKRDESVLVIADSTDITAKNHSDQEVITVSTIGSLLFNGLMIDDLDGKFHNIIAEQVKVLKGGKAVEVKLRGGIRFHDGREMTAKDVASSFSKMMEYDRYLKEKYGTVRVEILDGLTIRFPGEVLLSEPQHLLSNIFVISEGFIGTGPYKVGRWLEDGVELEANDEYFEGKPRIRKIRYIYEEDERKRVNMMLKGEADLLSWLSPEMVEFLKKDDRFYVNELTSAFYTAVFLNNDSALFRDRAVRRAISLAIDREKMIEKIAYGGGKRTNGPLPPGSFPQKGPGEVEYAPKKAAKLLKDAGWRDVDGDGIVEKDGRKLAIKMIYDGTESSLREIADFISMNLFEVGVEVNPVPVEDINVANRTLLSGDYDAALQSRASGDSINIATWRSTSTSNLSHYKNIEMDALLELLRRAKNMEERREVYGRMQDIFERDVPAIFLYNPIIYSAVNKRIKGGEGFVDHVYATYKIKDWSIDNE